MSDIKRVLPLAGANCIGIIALGINIPLLSFYVVTLGGTDFQAAIIFAVFSMASFMVSPLWGRLSDKIGRKPAIIASLFLTIVAYIWLGLADDMWEVFGSRVLAGLSSGWMSIPLAYVGDVTSKENRAKGMGLIGAGFGVGFTIGPPLQALLVGPKDNPDFFLPIMVAAAFSVVAMLIVMVFVTEPERHRADKTQVTTRILSDKNIVWLVAIYFSVFLVWTGIEGIFALWSLRKFDLGPADVGYFLGVGGIVTALIQGGLIGRLVKRYGEASLVMAGVVILAFSMFWLANSTAVWMIYAVMALFGIAKGFFTPAMQSLFSRLAPAGRQGEVMGAAQSSLSLARVLGPAWAVLVFVTLGHSAPFLIGALFLLPVMIAIFVMNKKLNLQVAEG